MELPLTCAPFGRGAGCPWLMTRGILLGALTMLGPRPMPRIACSYCHERQREKTAQIYQWWYAGEDRIAYKMHSCAGCLVDRWKNLLATSNSTLTGEPTCIACGGGLEADDSTVYLNLYLPKQPERQFELDLCAPCAASILADTYEHGTRLENRGAQGEGPGSSAPHPSPWDAIEL